MKKPMDSGAKVPHKLKVGKATQMKSAEKAINNLELSVSRISICSFQSKSLKQ